MKIIAIVVQALIFIIAWLAISNQIMDNTYFGLIVSYDVMAENIRWIMLGTAILSVLNIWLLCPKKVKVAKEASLTEGTKSAKAEEVKAEDPVVPKMD